MASYRISEDAKADLNRIYRRGVRDHGEAHFDAFFKRFEHLARQPSLYQAVNDIRPGYRRSVCGVDSIYYRVVDDIVEIMRILGQQDVGEWL